MIRLKLLFAALVGTLVYVGLSATLGQTGLKSYSLLEEQKREISLQTSEIQTIHDELELEATALQNDRDLIASYARKLDYVSDGEKLVKINGLRKSDKALYDTGTILYSHEITYLSDEIIKILAIFAFLLTFILLFMLGLSRGEYSFKRKKKEFVAGIPVYDLPQI